LGRKTPKFLPGFWVYPEKRGGGSQEEFLFMKVAEKERIIQRKGPPFSI
jgi:hypothetical protein